MWCFLKLLLFLFYFFWPLLCTPLLIRSDRPFLALLPPSSIFLFCLHSSRSIFSSTPPTPASRIFKADGIRGLSQGATITLMRNVPANAWYIFTYELIRRKMTPEDGGRTSQFGVFLAGGVGGMSYWITTYPTDVIKSTLQVCGFGEVAFGFRCQLPVMGGEVVSEGTMRSDPQRRGVSVSYETRGSFSPPTAQADKLHGGKYKGIIDCAQQMWRAGGVRSFMKGFGPCMARSFPANAAAFVVYELAWDVVGRE